MGWSLHITRHGALSWSHRPQCRGPGGTCPWSHDGTTAPLSWSHRGTMTLFSWSHGGRFHGTTRGPGTTPWSHVLRVKEGLWSHPLPWGGDHAWSWDHGTRGPPSGPTQGTMPRRGRAVPRAATGHRVRPGVRAHSRSRTVKVARPPVVVAPLTGSGEGTAAGNARTTRAPS